MIEAVSVAFPYAVGLTVCHGCGRARRQIADAGVHAPGSGRVNGALAGQGRDEVAPAGNVSARLTPVEVPGPELVIAAV